MKEVKFLYQTALIIENKKHVFKPGDKKKFPLEVANEQVRKGLAEFVKPNKEESV